MKEKSKYTKAEIDILTFENSDIVTTSSGGGDDGSNVKEPFNWQNYDPSSWT